MKGVVILPSDSYKVFKNEYMKDIEKIISNYETIKGIGKGKRSIDHLMRGGLLLLAAAWEVYIEEVLYESAVFVASNVAPFNLPREIKKTISKSIIRKSAKNEIAPFECIHGDQWKDFYLDIVSEEIGKLNTPKTQQINDLFNRYLGIDEICSNYRETTLDDFISFRGEIAHRMKAKEYLKLDIFKGYVKLINHLVEDHDIYLYKYLKGLAGKTPWNNTYK
jgi:RiboL-PSP-HEPN